MFHEIAFFIFLCKPPKGNLYIPFFNTKHTKMAWKVESRIEIMTWKDFHHALVQSWHLGLFPSFFPGKCNLEIYNF